jgi:hypothetical protein
MCRLVAGIASIIGDPLHSSSAAAMHKCLVCDKPVNTYDSKAPSSVLSRPATAVVGYDKVDDPLLSVPPSPIKKPSSASASGKSKAASSAKTPRFPAMAPEKETAADAARLDSMSPLSMQLGYQGPLSVPVMMVMSNSQPLQVRE